MRSVKIGKYVIPMWFVITLLISGIGGISAYYVWETVIVNFEVKEPLEILYYPSELSLFPGETEKFNVAITNKASINYSVILEFLLGNSTYQDDYVTFSDEIYTVILGQQNLTAWVMVESDAPPVNASLTAYFRRGVYPEGLVGYWRFDEGSGTTAYDSSGNDYHGILVNGPVWADVKYGKALSFDGIDDYVNCGTLGTFGSAELANVTSYAFWLKTSRVEEQTVLGTINDGYTTGIAIHLNVPETDKLRIYVRDEHGLGSRLSADLAESFDFTGTGWHHFVVVADVKSNSVTFYIDGELKPIVYQYRENPTTFSDLQYPLVIGTWNLWGDVGELHDGFGHFYEGIIDEVMIFNKALSPEEVEAIYISG